MVDATTTPPPSGEPFRPSSRPWFSPGFLVAPSAVAGVKKSRPRRTKEEREEEEDKEKRERKKEEKRRVNEVGKVKGPV